MTCVMEIVGTILIIAVIGGGGYLAWWAIQRTLADEGGRNRRSRRSGRKR